MPSFVEKFQDSRQLYYEKPPELRLSQWEATQKREGPRFARALIKDNQKHKKKLILKKTFFVFNAKMSFLASKGQKLAKEIIFKSKQRIFESRE